MFRSLLVTSVVASLFGAVSCTVTSRDASVDAGAAGKPDASAGDASAPPLDVGPLRFTPSNVDLSGIDLSNVGDFIVADNECSISTDVNLASCAGSGPNGDVLGFKIATQSDGSTVAVYVAKSMVITAGSSLAVVGSRPFVFIALDTITIEGTLNGSSREDVGVAGGQSQHAQKSKGGGPGGGGAGTETAASGGGSFCGVGGAGAAESGAAPGGGSVYGTSELVPLIGGSSGGGANDSGGSGGGAIQLVAATSIEISPTGVIHVGGGGGGPGGISGQEANGGGSGGAILIESLSVEVAGILAANGGGGGAGTSADVGSAPPLDPGGANSTPNATAAPGGKMGIGPSSGGSGSAGLSVDGTDGALTPGHAAGGGGGGSGRIRINSKLAQATVSGTLSPAAGSPCTTMGMIRLSSP